MGLTLLCLGIGILVAVAICIALLCRDRKAKSLDKLGPRALDAQLRRERDARWGRQ